jgi:hypothetical protein
MTVHAQAESAPDDASEGGSGPSAGLLVEGIRPPVEHDRHVRPFPCLKARSGIQDSASDGQVDAGELAPGSWQKLD